MYIEIDDAYDFIDDLRSVAHEWVKKLSKDKKVIIDLCDKAVNDENEDEYLTQLRVVDSQIVWIKHFFNLDGEV